MRILVIDDDTDIRQFLRQALEAESFAVDTAGDGSSGSYMARVNCYDAVILDHILPKKNGREVLREIRASGKSMPVLMLSVQGAEDDKAGMLDQGADDYMTKPFSTRELVSRLRALMRRPTAIVSPLLRVGDFVIDSANQRATLGTKEIYLTRKEFALAEYLIRNSGSVVSRGMLMEHVWNESADPFSNTIETHMRNLRKKIGRSAKSLIQTVPGRGYRVAAERMVMG